MKPTFFIFLLAIAFSSCKDATGDNAISNDPIKDTTRYGTEKFTFPILNPKAAKLVKDWPIFQDFQRVSINLQNTAIEDYKYRSSNLLALTDSLAKNFPSKLFNTAIQSRLVVVKTRLRLLNQETKKDSPNPTNIEEYIKELRLAIENFIAQINEKVEKEQIDIQRREDEATELEKQRKALNAN